MGKICFLFLDINHLKANIKNTANTFGIVNVLVYVDSVYRDNAVHNEQGIFGTTHIFQAHLPFLNHTIMRHSNHHRNTTYTITHK